MIASDEMRCDLIRAYARLLRSEGEKLTQFAHALTEENRTSVLRRLSVILRAAKDLQSELRDRPDDKNKDLGAAA